MAGAVRETGVVRFELQTPEIHVELSCICGRTWTAAAIRDGHLVELVDGDLWNCPGCGLAAEDFEEVVEEGSWYDD